MEGEGRKVIIKEGRKVGMKKREGRKDGMWRKEVKKEGGNGEG